MTKEYYKTKESAEEYFEKHSEILVFESYAEFEKGDSIQLIGKNRLA